MSYGLKVSFGMICRKQNYLSSLQGYEILSCSEILKRHTIVKHENDYDLVDNLDLLVEFLYKNIF
jgi:hypothetical protein